MIKTAEKFELPRPVNRICSVKRKPTTQVTIPSAFLKTPQRESKDPSDQSKLQEAGNEPFSRYKTRRRAFEEVLKAMN